VNPSFSTLPLSYQTAVNFREMAEPVRLWKRFNANIVSFSLLCKFGHLGPERFDKMNVANLIMLTSVNSLRCSRHRSSMTPLWSRAM